MPYSKSKLELESNWNKFSQLIAGLFVISPQFYLRKLKLDYLKFDFKCKKER